MASPTRSEPYGIIHCLCSFLIWTRGSVASTVKIPARSLADEAMSTSDLCYPSSADSSAQMGNLHTMSLSR